MASAKYKKTFAIKFITYFITIIGTLSTLFQFGPLLVVEAQYRIDQTFGV